MNEIGAPQATLEGVRHEASIMAEAFVVRLRPTIPHYYLGAVGTRRDRQQEGIGAAVLTSDPRSCRSSNEPVFSETSASENVRFYAGLGFVTISETDMPDGGPHVWATIRDGLLTAHAADRRSCKHAGSGNMCASSE